MRNGQQQRMIAPKKTDEKGFKCRKSLDIQEEEREGKEGAVKCVLVQSRPAPSIIGLARGQLGVQQAKVER